MTQLKAITWKGEIIFSSHEFLSHHRVTGFRSYLRQVRKTERKLSPNQRQAGERREKSVNPSSNQFRRGLFQMLFLRLFVWVDLRDLWAQKEEMFWLLRSTAETRGVNLPRRNQTLNPDAHSLCTKTKERKACVCVCVRFSHVGCGGRSTQILYLSKSTNTEM